MDRMPRGIGSRCGVNWIWSGCQMELLQQLAGVAMAEDGVGGEIVGGVHEVGLGGGGFAGAADSGLGVADDAVVEIDQAGLNERARGRG